MAAMKFRLDHEVGGQDIEWHVSFTPGTPDTWHEPGDGPELEVERAMLLTHQVGSTLHRADILDLIVESAGGELPSEIYDTLLEKAEEACADARDDYEAGLAESRAEGRRTREGECDDF